VLIQLGQRQCDRRRETARLWIYEAQHGDATPAAWLHVDRRRDRRSEKTVGGGEDDVEADPGVAGSGESLFSPLRAALVRRACQASVAGRPQFTISYGARESPPTLLSIFSGPTVSICAPYPLSERAAAPARNHFQDSQAIAEVLSVRGKIKCRVHNDRHPPPHRDPLRRCGRLLALDGRR
jgi:hypothetical protein